MPGLRHHDAPPATQAPIPCMQRVPMTKQDAASGLPRDWLGIGLRPVYYPHIYEHQPAIDYFEIISDNFIGEAPAPLGHLNRIRQRYPIVLHGVGLNLLGHAALDSAYLDRIARLADLVDAPFVTDHLCWTGAQGFSHHDLLPVPYVPELIDLAAERAAQVQERLGRPFGLENLSSYVSFRASTMTEQEFYTSVVRRAGCWLMLDINNVYVSSENHGFDPRAYLDTIDYTRVLQVHLAGHTRELAEGVGSSERSPRRPPGRSGHRARRRGPEPRAPSGVIVDTHDRPVCDEVWDLYAYAWKRGGPFPTLLEWDAAIPAMPDVLREVEKARRVRS